MEENARRWERIEELFAAAADLPGDRQAAFIDQEAGSDDELKRQMRALLSHDRRARTRITQAIQGAAPAPDWSGRRAGPYRILREIGRGGMGLVFEAVRDDDEYRKTVALKIAPWWRDLRLLQERFRQERQILATLEHPNIARFLDGGTHDGIPYFAMEFVEGQRITEYARQLALRQKIGLFREVCAAVHYAHQNLVVHRDLKPANILVSHDGVPKLLDFGIAKLLSPFEEDRTLTHAAPWTPDYASPEQVRARTVTTRTDVYSLGLIFYEMLTGERAQMADTSSPLALDRSVCEQEIPPASAKAPGALARQIAGDLDRIIAKATEKDPDRRYTSVAEFSDDLGRYLEGRPVHARPSSTAYRLSKFLRRNWLPAGAAATALLGLAGGAIGFAWQAHVATLGRIATEQQRDRAAREHAIAEEQRDAARREQARAENLAREADAQRQRADERTSQMSGLAQHAVFDLYGAVANLSGSLDARRTMLQSTIEYLEQLRKEKSSDPEFERTLGDAYLAMGDLQGSPTTPSLGSLSSALQYHHKGLDILGPLATANPSSVRYQIALVGALDRVGVDLTYSGRKIEALGFYDKGLETARKAVAMDPHNPLALEQVGIVTRDLAELLEVNDVKRAEPYAQESLQIYTRLAGRDPENGDYLDNIATASNRLASIYSRRHDIKSAAEYIRRGTEIRERLLKLKPDDVIRQRNLLISYGRVGDILGGAFENLGDTHAAADYYRKCIAIASQMLARDPQSRTAGNDLATARMRLAMVLSGKEQRQESVELIEEALSGWEEALASAPTNAALRLSMGNALEWMARRYGEGGDLERALDCTKRAIELLTAPAIHTPEIDGQLVAARQYAGVLLAEKGDREGALAETRGAADIMQRLSGSVTVSFQGVATRYFSLLGEMHEALARGKSASPEARQADWRAARDAYQRAAAEWRKSVAYNREAEAALLESKVAEGDAQLVR